MRGRKRFRLVGLDALESREVPSRATGVGLAGLDALALGPRARAAQVGAGLEVAEGMKAQAANRASVAAAARYARRMTPTAMINQQYAAFSADLKVAFEAYLDSLAESQGSGTLVTQPLTAASTGFSGLLTVANVEAFGTITPESPLQLAVIVGGTAQGSYQATGTVGNSLILVSGPTADLPVGALVQATVTSAGDNATGLYLPYVQMRANVMAQKMVTYFNGLPIRLPKAVGPNRFPVQRNSIQTFIAGQIVGGGPDSLYSSISSVALPTSAQTATDLYLATINQAIEQSRLSTLQGVQLLFSGRDLLQPGGFNPTIPTGTK